MEIQIEIKGKVRIEPDDLNHIQADGIEELATILIRHGYGLKTKVTEVYAKEAAKV